MSDVFQKSADFVSPVPPIGLYVQWYDRGIKHQRQDGAHIFPAVVLNVPTPLRGVVDLRVQRSRGVQDILGVRHIDDPALKQFQISRAKGGWDYVPGMVVNLNEPTKPMLNSEIVSKVNTAVAMVEKLRSDLLGNQEHDIEERILKAARLHPADPAKVAQLCQCSGQKVRAVLAKVQRDAEEIQPEEAIA